MYACVQVVYPLHQRNCPINATNPPTRQGGEGGTCVICTALYMYVRGTDTEIACSADWLEFNLSRRQCGVETEIMTRPSDIRT